MATRKRKDEIFKDLKLYFGKALARLRGNRSQEALAKLAGMDSGTLRRLEKGESPLRQDYVSNILRSLEVTLVDLLRSVADCYEEAERAPYHEMSRDELLRSLRKLHDARARWEREASEIDLEIKRRQIPDVQS